MMIEDAMEVVRLRNDFYRHNYRKLLRALMLSLLMLTFLTGTLAYLITHPPAPRYFATTSDGRLTPMVPLNTPNLSNATLLQWANTAAVSAFSYNFTNHREALQKLSEYFTEEGWKGFGAALVRSNNLDAVLNKKLVVSAVATGVPVILEQGTVRGHYTWRVQLPLLIKYQSASEFTQQSAVVTLVIERTSTLHSILGIGITQFIVSGTTHL